MKAALRARESDRLKAIRLLLAAVKQREVDERVDLTDADVLAVVDKLIKQRRDSIEQFERAGRQDLVAAETAELEVLRTYLPPPLRDDEIEALVVQAIVAVRANGLKDMGAVMAHLRPALSGRADMSKVSQQVKSQLGG